MTWIDHNLDTFQATGVGFNFLDALITWILCNLATTLGTNQSDISIYKIFQGLYMPLGGTSCPLHSYVGPLAVITPTYPPLVANTTNLGEARALCAYIPCVLGKHGLHVIRTVGTSVALVVCTTVYV